MTASDDNVESSDTDQAETAEDTSSAADRDNVEGRSDGRMVLDRSDESQDFVDQSVIDFDPDDGLYSGTAVTGDTDIPGAHVGEDGKVHDDGSDEAAAARGDEGAADGDSASADAEHDADTEHDEDTEKDADTDS